MKIPDICYVLSTSGKEFSLSHLYSPIIDSWVAKIEVQRKHNFRYLESFELTLCLTCKYSGISEFSDQIVPISLQRKICIEFI